MKDLEAGLNKVKSLGCPDEVVFVVRTFVEMLVDVLSDQKLGVLLVGSASRGEFSWDRVNQKLYVFSDIEFLVAVSDKKCINKCLIASKVRMIEDNVALGEFFHIDFTFIEWSSFKSLETKFFIFESKQCGIDFCTNKVSPFLPVVNRDNLRWKELNEVLIHRVSSILHAIPLGLLFGKDDRNDEQSFCLNLAKNVLDLTTWLHPYESEKLVAGYGNRLDEWESVDFEGKILSNYITIHDVEFIRGCLNLRKSPFTPLKSVDMLREVFNLYVKSLSYVKHMNNIDEREDISSFGTSRLLFDEYRPRQWVSQTISLTINFKKFGLKRYVKNICYAKRGFAAKFCLIMIEACIREIDSKSGIDSVLKARSMLGGVILVDVSMKDDFYNVWTNTKMIFRLYQQITRNY